MKSFNCLADQELREGIKEYSEWPTIPQVYVKGEFVGGCDIILSSKRDSNMIIPRTISADMLGWFCSGSASIRRAREAVDEGGSRI